MIRRARSLPKNSTLLLATVGIALATLAPALARARTSASERAPLHLAVGEQRLLSFPGLRRYSLGAPLVRVLRHPAIDDSQLLMKAIKSGQTDLWVWNQDGAAERRPLIVHRTSQGLALLQQALSSLQEIEVLYGPQGYVLRGEIHSREELARVAALLARRPSGARGRLIDETRVSEPLLAAAERELEAWLASQNLKSQVRLERVAGELWARGTIPQPQARAALAQALRSRYPRIELDLRGQMDDHPTIHFRVFLLELKKSAQGALGVRWPEMTNPGALLLTSSGLKRALNLELAIQALEGEGSLRILSNPELVVRAPGRASLFAGGELPIRNVQFTAINGAPQANIDWRPFGLSLKLDVKNADARGVRLDIATEVSHIDTTLANADQVPGLQANRLTTQVDAEFGVPLLLSGLLQEGMRRSARGLPLLRRLPVLGSLFGSEDYLNDRSELVAILLPHTTPPAHVMQRVDSHFPSGPNPAPRNWLSPDEVTRTREATEWPWNAFARDARKPARWLVRAEPRTGPSIHSPGQPRGHARGQTGGDR